jgi:hypothetical protein
LIAFVRVFTSTKTSDEDSMAAGKYAAFHWDAIRDVALHILADFARAAV